MTTQSMIRRLVDDINEEESMQTLGGNPNHIKWLTGHLVLQRCWPGLPPALNWICRKVGGYLSPWIAIS